MSLSLPHEVLYDQRLVERHIQQGLLTREQWEQHIAELEDITGQAAFVKIDHSGHRHS
jgi:hypothetical protein